MKPRQVVPLDKTETENLERYRITGAHYTPPNEPKPPLFADP